MKFKITIFIIILLIIIIAVLFVFSRKDNVITFINTYGGKNDDSCRELLIDDDGGYVLFGDSSSFSNSSDMYLLKTDVNGELLWKKTYGGTDREIGTSIKKTSDGGYVLFGSTSSFGVGSHDMYLIKTDKMGKQLWYKTYGNKDEDNGKYVAITSDNGFIMLGDTNSFDVKGYAMYLVKADGDGNVQWEKILDYELNEWASQVLPLSDGGCILAGKTRSIGADMYDMYIIRIDSAGNILWEKTFGKSNDESAESIVETKDGNFLISGWRKKESKEIQSTPDSSIYVLKINGNGDIIWEKILADDCYERGYYADKTLDDGYIITGVVRRNEAPPIYNNLLHNNSESVEANENVFLTKLDKDGNKLWLETFGGDKGEHGYSVKQTSDGGYIIGGVTHSFGEGGSDVYLIKTDKDGNVDIF